MHRFRPVLLVLFLLALVAAACGSDDGGGDVADDADGSGAVTSETTEDTADPVSGGTLTVGLDAETDGWNPAASQWSTAGYTVGNSIFDPLVAMDENYEPQPYLAESVEPNEDHTVWTVTLRPDITFHNDEPLNADALLLQFTKIKESPIVGQLFGPMESWSKVDDLTVDVQMSEPWVAFPALLTTQGGYVAAPEQLNAPADEAAAEPIGTGPYVFEEWRRDDRFSANRYDGYWQEGLPYPEAVEYRVIPDPDTRLAALQSGQIDLTTTFNSASILALRDDPSIETVEFEPAGTAMIMLNTAVEPLDDVRIRQALALATDQQQLIDTVGRGLGSKSVAPYPEDSVWFAETGYPTDANPEEARALVEEYKSENGITGDIPLTLGCTPVGTNPQSMALIQEQWGEVGIDVETNFTEQAVYITNAIFGDYQANCWAQFGADDPDIDATWWLGRNVAPPGEPALNFARHDDEVVNENLVEARRNPDREARKEAYARVWERFAESVPYVWTTRSPGMVAMNPRLHFASDDMVTPDGAQLPPIGDDGVQPMHFRAIWLEN